MSRQYNHMDIDFFFHIGKNKKTKKQNKTLFEPTNISRCVLSIESNEALEWKLFYRSKEGSGGRIKAEN